MTRKYSKFLVTGGAGFIGSHLVDRLMEEDVEVTVVDNLITGKTEILSQHKRKKNFRLVESDIRDFDVLKSLVKEVDAIFHEAALVSVTRSVENPLLTNEVNVTGTLNLLRACLNSDVQRFIYASSSSVYGETETLPKHEELTPQPISPYAVSKLAAETYVRVFNEVYGLQTVSLRYFNVYGPRQTYGPYSGVISIFTNRLLENQSPIIYGDGEQTRDFTYVQDVVEANLKALNKKNAVGEVFNIATGTATTINQLAKKLQEITGKTQLKPTHSKPRPSDIKYSYADITKAKKTLGYRPKVSLEMGLQKFIEYQSKQI